MRFALLITFLSGSGFGLILHGLLLDTWYPGPLIGIILISLCMILIALDEHWDRTRRTR